MRSLAARSDANRASSDADSAASSVTFPARISST